MIEIQTLGQVNLESCSIQDFVSSTHIVKATFLIRLRLGVKSTIPSEQGRGDSGVNPGPSILRRAFSRIAPRGFTPGFWYQSIWFSKSLISFLSFNSHVEFSFVLALELGPK